MLEEKYAKEMMGSLCGNLWKKGYVKIKKKKR